MIREADNIRYKYVRTKGLGLKTFENRKRPKRRLLKKWQPLDILHENLIPKSVTDAMSMKMKTDYFNQSAEQFRKRQQTIKNSFYQVNPETGKLTTVIDPEEIKKQRYNEQEHFKDFKRNLPNTGTEI